MPIRVNTQQIKLLRSAEVDVDEDVLDFDVTQIGFFGATPVAQQTDIVAKTDNSGGTDDDVIAAMPGNSTTTNISPTVDDNMATLTVAINEIRTVLRNLGLMA